MARKSWLARAWMLISVMAVLLPARAAQAQDERCFPETGYCISGRFRAYWEQHGGLAVFGYPLSPAYQQIGRNSGQYYLTQWFERTRFELHDKNPAPYDVLLGLLGDDALLAGGRWWRELPAAAAQQPGCLWFADTRHNLCDQAAGSGFKRYWESHGLEFDGRPGTSRAESLALFGMPLTEPAVETNSSGDAVLTQWFERARFEWHPNNPDQFKVLLGLVGSEVLFPFAPQPNPGLAGAITIVSTSGPGHVIYRMKADGSRIWLAALKEEQFLAQAANGLRTAVSPDKTLLALQMRHEGVSGLYVVNRITGAVTRINADPTAQPLDWAPDGGRLVYLSGLDERLGLHAVRVDGAGEIRLTISRPGEMPLHADWSPAGDRIAYDAHNAGSFVVNADGTQRIALPAAVERPRWMPDGQQIIYTIPSWEENPGVYVVDPAGGQPRLLIKHPVEPEFSPDGRSLSFIAREGNETALYAMNSDGSHERKLISGSDARLSKAPMPLTTAVWSPDSQYLAVSFGSCQPADPEGPVCGGSEALAVRQDGREVFALARLAHGQLFVREWLAE